MPRVVDARWRIVPAFGRVTMMKYGYHFFKFPKDHQRCASWVEKCEAKYLPTTDLDVLHKTYKLCSLHFENGMFMNALKNRLNQTAIPTIFAKKPAVSKDISLVGSENIEISNVSNDISSMTDDIFSTDNRPSCSTPCLPP
ncbi:52 kDa repressor of the inhibitor of the protein kinase, partial [Aphis craccivora]